MEVRSTLRTVHYHSKYLLELKAELERAVKNAVHSVSACFQYVVVLSSSKRFQVYCSFKANSSDATKYFNSV